jgi:hypothetical protein
VFVLPHTIYRFAFYCVAFWISIHDIHIPFQYFSIHRNVLEDGNFNNPKTPEDLECRAWLKVYHQNHTVHTNDDAPSTM